MSEQERGDETPERAAFVARYGGIYEHSPWVAERAFDGGADLAGDLPAVMRRVVERAGRAAQLALLRAHPDLAGRLAVGALTASSAAEQTSAGLDRCTEAEFEAFRSLNRRYVARFGFPFIIAVRGLDRAAILEAFGRRVAGEPHEEFRTALEEVHKIARLRLAALDEPVAPEGDAVEPAALRAVVVAALRRHGADGPNALAIADAVLAAERDGAVAHGLYRVPGLVEEMRDGLLNGAARPRLLDGPEAAVLVDGDRGAAAVAYKLALPELAARAERLGAAVLALRNTVHLAALWPEVEWLAERGLAAFAATGNRPYLAPAGGRRPVFGTNPIAFAYPRPGMPPVVVDLASSSMARGDIEIAARDGRRVPPGVGIDREGRETTDPAAILAGSQLPFGGYKGSALALMVELLAAGVVGDIFSDEVPGLYEGRAGVPPEGVFLLALSPESIGGPGTLARANAFLERLAAEPGVRLPGARRHARRSRGGPLTVDARLLATLRALAGEA